MSNKELCISLINNMEENLLDKAVFILKNITKITEEFLDDAYCMELYGEYLKDLDPDKQEAVLIENYAEELGILLNEV